MLGCERHDFGERGRVEGADTGVARCTVQRGIGGRVCAAREGRASCTVLTSYQSLLLAVFGKGKGGTTYTEIDTAVSNVRTGSELKPGRVLPDETRRLESQRWEGKNVSSLVIGRTHSYSRAVQAIQETEAGQNSTYCGWVHGCIEGGGGERMRVVRVSCKAHAVLYIARLGARHKATTSVDLRQPQSEEGIQGPSRQQAVAVLGSL